MEEDLDVGQEIEVCKYCNTGIFHYYLFITMSRIRVRCRFLIYLYYLNSKLSCPPYCFSLSFKVEIFCHCVFPAF